MLFRSVLVEIQYDLVYSVNQLSSRNKTKRWYQIQSNMGFLPKHRITQMVPNHNIYFIMFLFYSVSLGFTIAAFSATPPMAAVINPFFTSMLILFAGIIHPGAPKYRHGTRRLHNTSKQDKNGSKERIDNSSHRWCSRESDYRFS